MASPVDTFLQDKKNIDKLARYLATLYERIVQPEKLATKLYSNNALPNLPEFSVWEIRGNVALTRHIIEESFKRRAVKELFEALQESGNDHVYKEISEWAQKEVKTEIQVQNNGSYSNIIAEASCSHASDTTEASFRLPSHVTVESTSCWEEGDNLSETQPVAGPGVDETLALGKKIISLVALVGVISTGFYLGIWPTESRTVPTLSSTTSTTTSTTTTPKPTSPGIFVATAGGLIAFNLLNLETTHLTRLSAIAVAVNNNLNKVYWSASGWESHIIRSNFDGSDQEIIVEQRGDTITVLAIDDTSGNVYYGLFLSSEIRRCNAVGRNCNVIISSSLSSFANPYSISLDSENGVIYLTGGRPGSGFIRANMDGRNATIVDGRFTRIYGITLDKNSNNLLYWTDEGGHAIGTIDINGLNKKTLKQLDHHTKPAIIQVDDNHIYFSMAIGDAIFSANKHNGEDLKAFLNYTRGASGLAMFNIPV